VRAEPATREAHEGRGVSPLVDPRDLTHGHEGRPGSLMHLATGVVGRCEACNGGPEHHDEKGCKFHWVYRGRDGVPFRLVMLHQR
jgi:hypothetical protein